jgi:hypothetical protein
MQIHGINVCMIHLCSWKSWGTAHCVPVVRKCNTLHSTLVFLTLHRPQTVILNIWCECQLVLCLILPQITLNILASISYLPFPILSCDVTSYIIHCIYSGNCKFSFNLSYIFQIVLCCVVCCFMTFFTSSCLQTELQDLRNMYIYMCM